MVNSSDFNFNKNDTIVDSEFPTDSYLVNNRYYDIDLQQRVYRVFSDNLGIFLTFPASYTESNFKKIG